MHQFLFFPYFPVDDIDLRVNRVHLFNFWRHKDTYIPDSLVKDKIEKFCSLYVDNNLEVIRSLTIAVIDNNYSFTHLTDEQLNDLRRFASALLFASIINNQTNSVCVSEQFALVHQNFNLTEDAIVFTTGSFYRVQNWQSFEMTRLVRPAYVPSNTLFYRFDDKLLEGFANVIDDHSPDNDYLFRTLEWVGYTFINSEGYSGASRHVMLATAFEIFFDLPDFGKADEFAGKLESLLEVDKMEIYDKKFKLIQTGLTPVTKKNAVGKDKTNTMYGWWARDFYHLRSKIVHGDEITNADIRNHNNEQHLIIGLKMLAFCFYKLLENKGYLVFETIQNIPAFAGISYERISTYRDLRKIEQLIS